MRPLSGSPPIPRALAGQRLIRVLTPTPKRLGQLRRLGLLRPGGAGYRLRAVVAVRAVLSLLEAGATVRRLRRALERLQRLLPESESPLSECRFRMDGPRVLLESETARIDLSTGQALLGFEEEPRRVRGLVRRLVSQTEVAEDLFERALESHGHPARWEEAAAAYNGVLALDASHAGAWNNLGLLHHRMGHHDRAEECYRAALAADPTSCEARYNLGALHEDTGDLPGAIGWYQLAIEVNPDYADPHFNLAGLLFRTGRTQEAARHWRRYLELDPESSWADLARAHLGETTHGSERTE